MYSIYRVGTDGSRLQKLSDFPMQELIVLEDKVYFRSVYDREYDPFYQLTEEAAEDDKYLYSMNLDGSGCELLVSRLCMEFMTDGKWLYYLVYEDGDNFVLYKSSLDGEMDCLVHLNVWGGEEILASDVWSFIVTQGQIYVINDDKIRRIALTTGRETLLIEREKVSENGSRDREDTYS